MAIAEGKVASTRPGVSNTERSDDQVRLQPQRIRRLHKALASGMHAK